jgi:prolyl 4-hydroxylase
LRQLARAAAPCENAGVGVAEQVFAVAEQLLNGRPQRLPDYESAVQLYRALSESDYAPALMRCAVLTAEGLGCEKDWPAAIGLLRRAAEAGAEKAQGQLRVLAGGSDSADWRALERAIDLDALLTPKPLDRLTDRAGIGVSRGFAPPGVSEWVIDLVRTALTPAKTFNPDTKQAELDEGRTALDAPLDAQARDVVCAVLEERAARLTGLPIVCHEGPSVISYEVGQEYRAHYDFIPPAVLESDATQRRRGQRTVTVVTYLSDDFDGGETAFTRLDLKFKPAKGDALVWMNVLPNGSPDPATQHAGLAPTRGRKWILSQWIRDRPQLMR